MAITDRGKLVDGFAALTGGMDSGVANTLRPDQASLLVNYSIRDYYPQTRPAYIKRADNVASGRFQGAGTYESRNGDAYIVLRADGYLYSVELDSGDYNVVDITPSSGRTNPRLEQAWIEQAEDWIIVQDGQSKPTVWDGVSSRYLDSTAQEIPTGSMLAYGQGRVWVASPDRRNFLASDLVFSTSGTSDYNFRDSILKVTENTHLAEGGTFALPRNGKITAMKFMAHLDSALGDGPLQVATRDSIYSINTPIDRTTWALVQYPIQTISAIGTGPVGANAVVNVNGDLWYRSEVGIQSFAMQRRDFKGWTNTPQSSEMNRILERDGEALLGHCSMAYWKNWLLTTTYPVRSQDYGVYWKGLAVLDFDPISRLYAQELPAWSGVWTGLNIHQVVTVRVRDVLRCFLVCRASDNNIDIWEISTDDRFDNLDTRIQSIVESRAFGFGDQGNFLKRLESASIWHDRIAGELDVTAKYRPDFYPLWRDWDEWEECANFEDCTTPDCGDGPVQYREQYRARRGLPQPDETIDIIDNKPYRNGYFFQIKLTTTGFHRLRQVRLEARVEQEYPYGGIGDQVSTCEALSGCEDDIWAYSSEA